MPRWEPEGRCCHQRAQGQFLLARSHQLPPSHPVPSPVPLSLNLPLNLPRDLSLQLSLQLQPALRVVRGLGRCLVLSRPNTLPRRTDTRSARPWPLASPNRNP